jgi:5-methylcytosine-specific restriction endonuclease McrA
LRLLAGNQCRKCGQLLSNSFHADHKQAFSKGGRTVLANGEALCKPCNERKGAR